MNTAKLGLVVITAALGSFGVSCGGSGDAVTPDPGDGGGANDGGNATRDGSVPDGGSAPDGGGNAGPDGSTNTDAGTRPDSGVQSDGGPNGPIKTVFVILMENHNWSSIKGSASAPYINNTLLPIASRCESYFDNPKAAHPSEPNYLWLEAGDNFGILDDKNPSVNHQATTSHLVTLLKNANISWRTYVEGISGSTCPITSSGLYAPKHTPMLFFDDVVGNPPSTSSAPCIQGVRPYTELATDLAGNKVARYNFITPDLCNDMHNTLGCPGGADAVKNGDTWLAAEIPKIMASAAYADNGAIFITWDESEGGEFPIGMIVLSPKAKGNGYANTATKYYHSSMLRTVQEIFGVTPLLGDAANQPSLGDLFKSFP